jgi:hypothetical protein
MPAEWETLGFDILLFMHFMLHTGVDAQYAKWYHYVTSTFPTKLQRSCVSNFVRYLPPPQKFLAGVAPGA